MVRLLGWLLAGISTALYIYVLQVLWVWFLVPLGAPTVGMLHIWGISLFTTLLSLRLTGEQAKKLADEDVETTREMSLYRSGGTIIVTLTVWGIGWITHWGMSW